jgi:FkbM family methyltransferase
MRVRKRLQLYLGLTKWYGQRKEDKIIAQFFGDFKGTLLSIGENDGLIYSNVLYFIKKGWHADLVEPAPKAFGRLLSRHFYNIKVHCHQAAIDKTTAVLPFWESDSLVNLGDTGLVSSLHQRLVNQWTTTKFRKIEIQVLTFSDFMDRWAAHSKYDLISIDAEGSGLSILKQMDLKKLGCRCLIIEHEGNITPYNILMASAGFRLLATTEENLIFVNG